MAEPGSSPPLMYSVRLEELRYLGSDGVVACEGKIGLFILGRPKANEE